MPRRARLRVAGLPLHIIQRGNNRQATFCAEEDYRFYLDCLLDASRKYGCLAYAYVLMTNRVHLLASAQQTYDDPNKIGNISPITEASQDSTSTKKSVLIYN